MGNRVGGVKYDLQLQFVKGESVEFAKTYHDIIGKSYQVSLDEIPSGTARYRVIAHDPNDSSYVYAQSDWISIRMADYVQPSGGFVDGSVVMERKYWVKHDNRYCYSNICFQFDNGQYLFVGYINTGYWNSYNDSRDGIYIISSDNTSMEINTKEWRVHSLVTEEWVSEKLVLASDGTVQYYMNGDLLGEERFDLQNLSVVNSFRIIVNPYGWWTTHHHYMDDFKITTPSGVITDSFAGNTLNLDIWEQPANPSGVFVEDGILKTIQKATDVDFKLVSKPIYISGEPGGEPGDIIHYDPTVPEAVDLGLPSGLKWASCNIGASAPEDYGDYFAWGETEPYYSRQDPLTWKYGKSSGYDWASYKWCNGSGYTLTKYNYNSSYGSVDNKYVLDPEDDAAAVNWGGSWRMPTIEEWEELIDECTWTWTTQNEVYGRLVTGPNNNSIFLPAAGSRDDTSLNGAGSYGTYWSSSLDTVDPGDAYYVNFYSDNVDRRNRYRCIGFSVRPVTE